MLLTTQTSNVCERDGESEGKKEKKIRNKIEVERERMLG